MAFKVTSATSISGLAKIANELGLTRKDIVHITNKDGKMYMMYEENDHGGQS